MERRYISITPEDVAVLQLEETLAHLVAAKTQAVRLLLAAKSLHAAMVAALTAALAGSTGTGAYSDKLRAQWLELLEMNREAVREVDLPMRVLNAADLLRRAGQPGAIEWATEPFICSANDHRLIERLTLIRDALEHPKPISNSFEIPWVAVTLLPALSVTQQALNAVAHHLDSPEAVTALIVRIAAAI